MTSQLNVDNIASKLGSTVGLSLDTSGNVTASGNVTISGNPLTPARPAFMARRYGGEVTVTNNYYPFASLTTDDAFSIGGHYDTSAYKFTCPVAGIYYFSCYVISQTSDVNTLLKIRKNGSDFAQSYAVQLSTAWHTHNIAIHANAAVNDYFQIYIGGTMAGYGNQWAAFSGHLVG